MNSVLWFAVTSGLAMTAAMLAAGSDAKQGMAGWGLAFLSGLAGWLIDLRSVRMKGERSVLISLTAHSVRAMGLLLVVVAVRMKLGNGCNAFVAATLAGYFVFLFGEVARLARSKV